MKSIFASLKSQNQQFSENPSISQSRMRLDEGSVKSSEECTNFDNRKNWFTKVANWVTFADVALIFLKRFPMSCLSSMCVDIFCSCLFTIVFKIALAECNLNYFHFILSDDRKNSLSATRN